MSLNVIKPLCARASGSRARALTRVVPCLSLRVCFGLSEESVYSMARHPYGESTKRRALFILEKLQMQGKLAESGLLLDTRISGDARQEIYLLVVNVVGADGSGDEVLAACVPTLLRNSTRTSILTFSESSSPFVAARVENLTPTSKFSESHLCSPD